MSDEAGITRARAIGVLAALTMGASLFVTSETLPIGLLMIMSADLDVSPSAVGQLVTSYGAVVVIATIPLTMLTRRVNRRILLSVLLLTFVVTTTMAALATSYWIVLCVRFAGALSQALFWAVVVVTAAGLFRPAIRGRVVAVVLSGSTIATVLGVPAASWLGEVAGWRFSCLALSALGLVVLVAVAVLLPSTPPDQGHAARGIEPDARRYVLLIAAAALATAGAFAAFTYIAPFLLEVGGFTPAAVGPLLLVRGLASLLGVAVIGVVVDRHPWLSTTIPIALQAVALLGLLALGGGKLVAVGLIVVSGLSFAALSAALGTRVLEVAPGRSDLATAGLSTAINVGITVGALTGGLLLTESGVRGVVLAGGVLSVGALIVAFVEYRFRPPLRQRRNPASVMAGDRLVPPAMNNPRCVGRE